MEKKEVAKTKVTMSQDHVWLKPDEFTLVKVGTSTGDAYVISFIEHVVLPAQEAEDGSGNYVVQVERRARTTMQVSTEFMKSFLDVVQDVERRTAPQV